MAVLNVAPANQAVVVLDGLERTLIQRCHMLLDGLATLQALDRYHSRLRVRLLSGEIPV